MPVTRINYQDTLRLRFDFGPDPDDPEKRLLRARSYTRGRPGATDEQYRNLAVAFARLYEGQLVNTYRVMHVELVESNSQED
jgi:hypothetical protein